MWVVYQCDLIGRGETPKNEVEVSRHPNSGAAYAAANLLKKKDRKHSFTVGCSA